MVKMAEELSIDLLKAVAKRDRRLEYMLERITISRYEDFVRVLYSELDMIIEDLEDNPELMQSDSEDRITIDIVGKATMRPMIAKSAGTPTFRFVIARKGSCGWRGVLCARKKERLISTGEPQACATLPGLCRRKTCTRWSS